MLMESIKVSKRCCPSCAAPLASSQSDCFVCSYCGSELQLEPRQGFCIPTPRHYPRPSYLGTVVIGNRRYRVHGRLGKGAAGDAYLVSLDQNLTELLLMKVGLENTAEVSLRQEWETVQSLRAQSSFLAHMLSDPVVLGRLEKGSGSQQMAAVYRWRHGFSFTLQQASQQYRQGIEAHHAVWIWNRILDQLACLEALGYSHNALRPEHLLLHPRDHGVVFCGWSQAERNRSHRDRADSGSCIASVLGSTAPQSLRQLACSAGEFSSSLLLQKTLKAEARRLFGPPTFRTFTLA